MKTIYRYIFLLIFIAGFLLFLKRKSIEKEPRKSYSFSFNDVSIVKKLSRRIPEECSMSACFNLTKCLGKPKKVYVYPDEAYSIYSPVYSSILKVIRESNYYTDNPDEACLFVFNIDTIDRDMRGENYLTGIQELINNLPKELWNNGMNHLIFNLLPGTYPDYKPDLGFNYGIAIIARASANIQNVTKNNYRIGFDVSFPLFQKELPMRTTPTKPIFKDLNNDKHLFSFKGKRYVYGIGSKTRDSLYHLHNGNSSIIATTCKHNTDWKKFEDDKCEMDNLAYENYDYQDLLHNSTFCLTPRGRRLGSYRFLESLSSGCIPVVLADNWELPFNEFIDWSNCVVLINEANVIHINSILRQIKIEKVSKMKIATKFIYHKYFSSVEKITLNTIDSIFKRIENFEGKRIKKYDEIYPKSMIKPKNDKNFTLILHGILKYSARLNRLVSSLVNVNELKKIIILWPKGRGQPPETEAFLVSIPIEVVIVDNVTDVNIFNLPLSSFAGDYVISMDERIQATPNETRQLLKQISIQQTMRIVSLFVFNHNKISDNPMSYSLDHPLDRYTMSTLHFAAFHFEALKQYLKWLTPPLKLMIKQNFQCHTVFFNAFLSDQTLNGPLWFELKTFKDGFINNRNNVLCFNKAVKEHWNGFIPFIEENIKI